MLAQPSTQPQREPYRPLEPGRLDRGYVLVPQRLLHDLADTPLALGLYCLAARLYLVSKAPVPLSDPDIVRFQACMSRGAVIRAFARLVRAGWLLEHKTAGGKSRYQPTWGTIAGQPRPWALGAPQLGKPRHIHAYRIDQRLLDTCIGILIPHPLRPAAIERWVAQPLLSLSDVGAYLLALAGQRVSTPALERLQLVVQGAVQPLPDDLSLLAYAQQMVQPDSATIALTPKGQRRSEQAQHMIRPMIPSMIGSGHGGGCRDSSPERGKPTDSAGAQRSARNQRIHTDLLPPTPSTDEAVVGGKPAGAFECSVSNHEEQKLVRGESRAVRTPLRQAKDEQRGSRWRGQLQLPETPVATVLRAINVRPSCVRELAGMELGLVERAIADGRSRADVEDLAGWVVAMLRDARDYGWSIAAARRKPAGRRPRERGSPTEAEIQAMIQKAKASGLFIFDEQQAGHAQETVPLPAGARAYDPSASSATVQPGPAAQASSLLDTLDKLPGRAGQEQRQIQPEELRRALLARVSPALYQTIRALSFELHDSTLIVGCPDQRHLLVVQAQVLPVLGSICRQSEGIQPLRLTALVGRSQRKEATSSG